MELGPTPLPGPIPALAARSALALRARFRALLDAAGPPELALFERSTGVIQTILVGTIAKLGIADILEERGPSSVAQIAEATATNVDALHRALRALSLSGIFKRREDGLYENNRLSSALCRGRPSRMREFAMYFASASNIGAWLDLEHILRTGSGGFERVHGKTVWDWFDEHPTERDNFAQAMMGLTVAEAPIIATLYPFHEVNRVCDVGGGRGTLLSELLIRHPHLRGILCDSNGVLDSAGPLLRSRGVADRVELTPGSFFHSVPPGADAYVLKNILHDWDDEHCRSILRTIRRAINPGQRVVVCETLVEKHTDDALGALSDLQMMVVCRGRERGQSEFRELLNATGFELRRIFEGAIIAVIEGVARA